jgi:hypothetical protein
MYRTISLKPLKDFARKEMKEYPIIRTILLEEADSIPWVEFLLKVRIWLNLLEKDIERKSSCAFW